MKHPEHFPDTHHNTTENTFFGVWLYLMTDCVLFATLFAAYLVLQIGTAGGPTPRDLFSLPYALAETLILLTSSFTCGLAMLARKHLYPGLAATFILGAAFLAMELHEFSSLISQGATWQTSAFLSAYFTLIGVHGLHILFGLLFMIVFAWQTHLRGMTHANTRRLACFKLFWQFLYLIWIFQFIMVYLLGVK